MYNKNCNYSSKFNTATPQLIILKLEGKLCVKNEPDYYLFIYFNKSLNLLEFLKIFSNLCVRI